MVDKFDPMVQNTNTKPLNPYTRYKNTDEWIIISHLLDELIKNQDIELKTAPEYVIGYLVEKLLNKVWQAELFKDEDQRRKYINRQVEEKYWQVKSRSKT